VDLVVALNDDPQTINPPSNIPSALSIKSTPPSQTEVTRLKSLLFTGESSLEEWLTNDLARADDADNDDVSGMLERMGLLDEFDSLFVRTLDFLGGFTGTTAEPIEEDSGSCDGMKFYTHLVSEDHFEFTSGTKGYLFHWQLFLVDSILKFPFPQTYRNIREEVPGCTQTFALILNNFKL
jgi:hypothetical protein